MSNSNCHVVFNAGSIDEIFEEFEQRQFPGAAVGVAISGRPVYRKAFGLADMEGPRLLSPTTSMRIASISKHFTCLAYMLLCEEGKARIDDPATKYLPELRSSSHTPTMRQLMGHTSGLHDACDWFFYDTDGRISGADILGFYGELAEVNAAPGTTWRYNDGAYFLLGVAIERIAGRPLEDVLHARIFEPVGMQDTMLLRWDNACLPNGASSHMPTTQGQFEKVYRFNEGGGQGGIVSTIDDMLRWLAHMDAPKVGNAETWRVMKTSQFLPNGTASGFGLGLVNGRYRGVDTLGHAGMLLGARSYMLKAPAACLDIIIMTNRHDAVAADLAYKIVDVCVPNLAPAMPVSAPFAVGTFRSGSTGRIIQLLGGQAQQMASIDGADLLFNRSTGNVLLPAPRGSHRKYAITLKDDQETPTCIGFSDFGSSDELRAVNPPEQQDIAALTGCYRSNSTGVEATISDSECGVRLRVVGRLGLAIHQLECLTDGVWRARSLGPISQGGILSFDANAEAFRLTTPATWNLTFQRIKE